MRPRKNLKKKEQELALIEEKILQIESKKSELEKKMADPDIFSDSKKIEETNQAYQKLKNQESDLNQNWETLVEEIGSLQEAASLA